MTIAIHLEEQTVRELRALALARGLSLEEYLDVLARQPGSQLGVTGEDPVKSFDVALDEFFAGDTREFPPITSTYSREDIYFDHD